MPNEKIIVEDRINGIDISGINPIISPAAIKQAGFEFVYIQCSRYSSTRDFGFDKTLDKMRGAGLRVGAYHFCSHDSDPERQAEFFYKASGGLGERNGDLPPMVDWEFCTPSKYKDHPSHCVKWLSRFMRTAEGLWYPNNADRHTPRRPVCYTYPSYTHAHQPALEQETGLGEYPLCYASYKSVPKPGGGFTLVPWLPESTQGPLHAVPRPFQKWTLWQYSGDGGLQVPGVAGYCDRQVFNGTSGDFAELLGLARIHNETTFGVKEDAFFVRQ